MTKVSVILTSLNHGEFLKEAIKSVLDQTYQHFELIIWDDASADDSWKIIKSFSDSRIKAFRNEQPKRGIYGINKSIKEVCKGEFIAIHHSDDVWEPNKLELQMRAFEKNNELGAVFTNALPIDEENQNLADETNFYFNVFNRENRSRQEWLNYFFFHGNCLCHPSILIKKECYEECGLYRFGLGQLTDLDMWVRLCLKYEIFILPEKLVRFRVHSNKSNQSASIPQTRKRHFNEYYQIVQNYLYIQDPREIKKIFQNNINEKFLNVNCAKFLLAQVGINAVKRPWCNLLGLNILYELTLGDRFEDQLENKVATSFDYQDLIELTGKHDFYNMEKVARQSEEIATLRLVNENLKLENKKLASSTRSKIISQLKKIKKKLRLGGEFLPPWKGSSN